MRFNTQFLRDSTRILKREWQEAEGFYEYFWLSAQWLLNGLSLLIALLAGVLLMSFGSSFHNPLLKVFWAVLAIIFVLAIMFSLRAAIKMIALLR